MNSDINIQHWARSLGYEKAEEKTFCDSWTKLVPPSMKSTWRHVISHVLPAEKARYIRKHCLLYNLELQERMKKGIKADIKSLKDFEKYQQIKNLNVSHSYLNGQIDDVYSEIKQLWTKLESQRVKQADVKEEEKEKLMKCKLLELKIKSTYEEIEKFKEMQVILDNIKSNYPVSENDEKEKEIIELCKKLPKFQEIQALSEKLQSLGQLAQKVKVENYNDKKDEILQEMRLMHLEKCLEAERERKNTETSEQKINVFKEKIIQKFVENVGDAQQVESLNIVLSSNMQKIVDKVKVKALSDLKKSWTVDKANCKTEYVKMRNEISLLDKQIESKLNEIVAWESGQDKLIQFCNNTQKNIIEEPKNAISDMKGRHPKLIKEIINDLNGLQSEIDFFLNTPLLRKNKYSGLMNSNPTIFECISQLAKYDEIIAQLKFALPHLTLNAEEVISEIRNNELLAGIQLKSALLKVKEIAKDINKSKLESQKNLKFWKEQPLAEGSCSSGEDYAMWRERLKQAVIEVQSDDDDTLLLKAGLYLFTYARIHRNFVKVNQVPHLSPLMLVF
ncbi:uncharacterized protein isoform X2 [Rhodnius prolixus]|uniref:uncharacterized protein isoform X2 n=1 Tax=Rhodnius prolixus TaxID=13249 RepID=UPI003D1899F4